MQTVRQLCAPHDAVFLKNKADTVANIGDLLIKDRIKPEQFFARNEITSGMKTLLVQVFDRVLEGSPQGVFRLKQAMGGGKTHSLIAAGLLAQNPKIRKTVFSEIGKPVSASPVRVAVFDGRETDSKHFLWTHLLTQLDRVQKWTGGPDQVPGPTTWAEMIGPEPCLIVLDELPPYLESLAMRKAGMDQTEADRLALGLANLMAAIATNRLPYCCLVLSDLVSSWQKGSAKIQVAVEEAMKSINNEASRVCSDVMPVRMDGSELYGILRKQLFSKLPSVDDIQQVSQGYAKAYQTAVQQNAIPASYERWAAKIVDTYPFHPGLDDLIARFRENSGFQQTREVLRMTQRMVAQFWQHKSDDFLLHPHALDFNDEEVQTMLDGVNPSLSNARSRDIAQRGAGIAENQSARLNDTAPVDAARIVYLSSLSTAANALQGLTSQEVAAYLCAPGRDVSKIGEGLLTSLEDDSWYLHRRTDSRWYYKQTKNVNSAIKERASVTSEDVRRKEVKQHLEKQFKPGEAAKGTKPLYQKLLVFPAIDDIDLDSRDVTLVISEPREDGLHPDLHAFWRDAIWKNRVMFLTGTAGFSSVMENAAYVKAAEDLLAEFKSEGREERSPEMMQAKNALENRSNGLRSALRESFTRLHYPFNDALESRSLKFTFAGNKYVGEETIVDSLREEQKFRDDTRSDAFRLEFEEQIFVTQITPWKDILETVARRPDWYWSPPGALETLKQECINKGLWRKEGGDHVRKGPFPKDKTSVLPSEIKRDDKTGTATLNVEAGNGDRVHYEIGITTPTSASPVVESGRLETCELVVSFLAIDSTGAHESGPVYVWKNKIQLRHKIPYRDGVRYLELECAPPASIRYSLDGSDPKFGTLYTGPVSLRPDAALIQAIAGRDEIWSNKIEVKVESARPDSNGNGANHDPLIDPDKPAVWSPSLSRTGRKSAFDALASLKRHGASVRGFKWSFTADQDPDRWLHLQAGQRMTFDPAELESLVENTDCSLTNGNSEGLNTNVKLSRLEFAKGAHLVELAKELGVVIKSSEVTQ